VGEGGSRRLTDEESFFFIVNTSSTAIARTPKTHFIRFGEPRSGPPSPTGEGYSILPLILHAFRQLLLFDRDTHITAVFYLHFFKIGHLKRYPFIKKSLCHRAGVAFFNTRPLCFGINVKKE